MIRLLASERLFDAVDWVDGTLDDIPRPVFAMRGDGGWYVVCLPSNLGCKLKILPSWCKVHNYANKKIQDRQSRRLSDR